VHGPASELETVANKAAAANIEIQNRFKITS
jgi:hypothetical protein